MTKTFCDICGAEGARSWNCFDIFERPEGEPQYGSIPGHFRFIVKFERWPGNNRGPEPCELCEDCLRKAAKAWTEKPEPDGPNPPERVYLDWVKEIP